MICGLSVCECVCVYVHARVLLCGPAYARTGVLSQRVDTIHACHVDSSCVVFQAAALSAHVGRGGL